MSGPNAFHTMTDEQLACWHQDQNKIGQLARELAEEQIKVENLRAAAAEEEDKLRTELSLRGDTIADLTMKYNDARSGIRRIAGELMQTLTALRRLVAAVEQFHNLNGCGEARGILDKLTREAKEVLTLLEIPF